MMFYRVDLRNFEDSSCGYQWFTSGVEANKASKQWLEENEGDDHATAEVEIVEIEPTKKGILDALIRFAGHADNG